MVADAGQVRIRKQIDGSSAIYPRESHTRECGFHFVMHLVRVKACVSQFLLSLFCAGLMIRCIQQIAYTHHLPIVPNNTFITLRPDDMVRHHATTETAQLALWSSNGRPKSHSTGFWTPVIVQMVYFFDGICDIWCCSRHVSWNRCGRVVCSAYHLARNRKSPLMHINRAFICKPTRVFAEFGSGWVLLNCWSNPYGPCHYPAIITIIQPLRLRHLVTSARVYCIIHKVHAPIGQLIYCILRFNRGATEVTTKHGGISLSLSELRAPRVWHATGERACGICAHRRPSIIAFKTPRTPDTQQQE